eukprot:Ihof_evm3s146 gene=Ihof_evmTU3s146
MAEVKVSTVVHVSNLCPLTVTQQLQLFFGFVGTVKKVDLQFDVADPQNPGMAFVEFSKPIEAALAVHLSSVHWMDRPLLIQPAGGFPGEFPLRPLADNPEAQTVLECAPNYEVVIGMPIPMLPGMKGSVGAEQPSLPMPPKPVPDSTPDHQPSTDTASTSANKKIQDGVLYNPEEIIHISDSKRASSPPASMEPVDSPMPDWARIEAVKHILHSSLEITRVDEIKRTIRVTNVSSQVTPEDLLTFFKMCGPINFVRLGGGEDQFPRFAFVEFTNQEAANASTTLNGLKLRGKHIKVDGNWWYHAGHSLAKQAEKEQRELNEAMRRLKEVEFRLNKQYNHLQSMGGNNKGDSDDRSHRDKDRHRDRDRDRTPERSHRRRSRSGRRSRSSERSHTRSRSRKRSSSPRSSHRRGSRRSRSRSRSSSPVHRSRSNHKHSRSRSRDRSSRRGRGRS